MNDRISCIKENGGKGLTQLIVSDPLSIRFLTGNHGKSGRDFTPLSSERAEKHTMLLNYLYFVKDTGFEEVWFSRYGRSDLHYRRSDRSGTDAWYRQDMAARFLIPASGETPQ